jgi:hypothetical protein
VVPDRAELLDLLASLARFGCTWMAHRYHETVILSSPLPALHASALPAARPVRRPQRRTRARVREMARYRAKRLPWSASALRTAEVATIDERHRASSRRAGLAASGADP